ncbi:24799_t:CDS:2, partial [Racocetra persica]
VQSLSESIESALREFAVRTQDANDPIDVSTLIKTHISCFNLINNIMQILRDKMTSSMSQDCLFLTGLDHQSSVFSNVKSCILKMSHSAFKMPVLTNKSPQNKELLQLSSILHKKAFEILEDFLKFVTEFLPSSDKPNIGCCEMLATNISDAETSVSDYPTLNLSWKYIIKLSIAYKDDIMKRRLKLDSIIYNLSCGASYNFSKLIMSTNSDETFQQNLPDVKQIDKMSTIVRFYVTHLLSIVKCYVE